MPNVVTDTEAAWQAYAHHATAVDDTARADGDVDTWIIAKWKNEVDDALEKVNSWFNDNLQGGDVQLTSVSGNTGLTLDTGSGDVTINPGSGGGDQVVLDGLRWPEADGSSGQYLVTDGSGSLSFSSGPSAASLSGVLANGNTSGAYDIEIEAGQFLSGTDAAASSNNDGDDLKSIGGDGDGSGDGGDNWVMGGAAGASGAGGSVILQGADGGASGTAGGSVQAVGGDAQNGNASGGPVIFQAGASSGTTVGAPVTISAGDAGSQDGGSVTITATNAAAGAGDGGSVQVATGGSTVADAGDLNVALGAGSTADGKVKISPDWTGDTSPFLQLFGQGTNSGTPSVYAGDRDPNSNVTGNPGDIYIRENGTSSAIYVHVGSSASNSDWSLELGSSVTIPGNLTLDAANATHTIGSASSPGSPSTHVEVESTGTYRFRVDDQTNNYEAGWEYDANVDEMRFRVANSTLFLVNSTQVKPITHNAMALGADPLRWSHLYINAATIGGDTTWDGDSPDLYVGSGTGTGASPQISLRSDGGGSSSIYHMKGTSFGSGDWFTAHTSSEDYRIYHHDGTAQRIVALYTDAELIEFGHDAQSSHETRFGNASFGANDEAVILLYGGTSGLPAVQFVDSGNREVWDESGQQFLTYVGGTLSYYKSATTLGIQSASAVLEMGSGGPTLRVGSGTPESAVTADVGSIYMRTDGGASTSIYVKESGTGNTGWVAK